MTTVDTAKSALMTQADYARHRECSREAVSKAVAAGRISVWGDDRLINARLADAEWAQNTRARVGTKPPGSEPPAPGSPTKSAADAPAPAGEGDYWKSRSRREAAEAEMAELKLQELMSELVRAADVRSTVARRAASLREGLMQIPARLSAVLAAESDAAKIHDQLHLELRQVLEQLTETTT